MVELQAFILPQIEVESVDEMVMLVMDPPAAKNKVFTIKVVFPPPTMELAIVMLGM